MFYTTRRVIHFLKQSFYRFIEYFKTSTYLVELTKTSTQFFSLTSYPFFTFLFFTFFNLWFNSLVECRDSLYFFW